MTPTMMLMTSLGVHNIHAHKSTTSVRALRVKSEQESNVPFKHFHSPILDPYLWRMRPNLLLQFGTFLVLEVLELTNRKIFITFLFLFW